MSDEIKYRRLGERTTPVHGPRQPKPPRPAPADPATCEHLSCHLQWIDSESGRALHCIKCETNLTGSERRRVRQRMEQERQERIDATTGPDSGNPQKPYRNS